MSLRLFVALELPEEPVEALLAWRPDVPGLRPVAREALHVTLAFLGAREEGDVEVVRALLAEVARPVARLALGEARWLPPRRPRVLAVELEDVSGALSALQSALVERLAASLDWRPERRPFLAHVTVARVRSGERVRAVEPPEPPPPVAFAATAVTLFRSHLSPRGARYEALARVTL